MAPDLPAAKRAGLPVDLDRLTAEGDEWLSAEERYALKTHGVCAQTQPGVFMLRTRTLDGVLDAPAARGLARLADSYGKGWLHLTTRQQIELHHVPAASVTTVLDEIAGLGLSNSSACGHTVRGVMSCPDAGLGMEEPFDCRPDARAVSDAVVGKAPGLNHQLPQRLNVAFGGCPDCRDHAKVNDAGFVSTVAEDGELGYELLLGGSLGKSAPTLASKAVDFLPRSDVLAAFDALLDVFTEHGNFDKPNKARLKFLIRGLGVEGFLERFHEALAERRRQSYPPPAPLEPLPAPSMAEVLDHAPKGGWGSGVRPQRTPGRALVTVNVPLGDLDGEDLRGLADLAEQVSGGRLCLTRNQNAMLCDVRVADVPAVQERLAGLGLGLEGADQSVDVRSCTGGPVCSLAITSSQAAGYQLAGLPALARNSDLRTHISGCQNACAQQQATDLGFSGGKVTIDGEAVRGYQVWLGGNLRADQLGQVVGRIAERDVPAITETIVGVWEALRGRGETLAETVHRIGLDAFQAQIDRAFSDRWEPGPEPSETDSEPGQPALDQALPTLPLVAA